jgi:hypothetical protein
LRRLAKAEPPGKVFQHPRGRFRDDFVRGADLFLSGSTTNNQTGRPPRKEFAMQGGAPRWIVVAGAMALGWLACQWAGGGREPLSAAVGPGGAASDLIAFTVESAGGAQTLYVVDGKLRTIGVYEYEGGRKSKLKLAAFRQFAEDQRLAEFNNDSPHVAEIEKLVRQR